LKIIFAFLFLLSLSVYAGGQYRDLSGRYSIGSELVRGDIEQGTSHLYLRIEGEAAGDLYRSLNAEEKTDECTNSLIKTQGHIICFKNSYCAFAINIETNTLAIGHLC